MKKMILRLTAAILVIACVLFCACRKAEAPTETAPEKTSAEPEPTAAAEAAPEKTSAEAEPTAAAETADGKDAETAVIPGNYTSKKLTTTGYFGTVSILQLYGDFENADTEALAYETWAKVKDTMGEMDMLFSTTIEDSEISRFNGLTYGESMEISADTAAMFRLAMEMYEKTDGLFNPATYPLTDLWGFSARFIASTEKVQPYDRDWTDGVLPLPDEAYIEAFLKLADPTGIELTGSDETGWRLKKNVPPVEVYGVKYEAKIDLGGLVKGIAAERVEEIMRGDGWEYGYFSCGSSSMCFLKSATKRAIENNNPKFNLGIRTPRGDASDTYAVVGISDEALSSSGDYENNYTVDGRLYCHIIDPRTGYPLNVTKDGVQKGICTVTLLSGSAGEDDALTTALCLMGPEKAVRYANENLKDRGVLFVVYSADAAYYESVTNLPADRLTVSDSAYRLASELDANGDIVYTGSLLNG